MNNPINRSNSNVSYYLLLYAYICTRYFKSGYDCYDKSLNIRANLIKNLEDGLDHRSFLGRKFGCNITKTMSFVLLSFARILL